MRVLKFTLQWIAKAKRLRAGNQNDLGYYKRL